MYIHCFIAANVIVSTEVKPGQPLAEAISQLNRQQNLLQQANSVDFQSEEDISVRS